MKSILKNAFLFSLPVLVGFALLYYLPYDRKFAYLSKNNIDCNTSWIYHRLFESPANIDIAFMGSSHTGCGINDGLIESTLDSVSHKKLNIVNLAYCGGGRNIDYILLKDLIKTKPPKIIVIEIKNSGDLIHRDYGIMADNKDLWFPPVLPMNYLATLYAGTKSRLLLLREKFVFGPKIEIDLKKDSNGKTNTTDEALNILPYQKKKKVIVTINEHSTHSFFGAFTNTVSAATIKTHIEHKEKLNYEDLKCVTKMCEIATENKIKFYFLYLPSYGNYFAEELKNSPYAKYGTILYPPDSIFNNINYWVDPEHLNTSGANFLSSWLSKKIAEL